MNASQGVRAALEAFTVRLKRDGFVPEETVFVSHSGRAAFDQETAPLGAVDLAAGLLLPRSLDGYPPGPALGEGLRASTEALKSLSQQLPGGETALERSRRNVIDGVEAATEAGFNELGRIAGDLAESPLTILGNLEKRLKGATPSVAAECRDGRLGPLARAMARILERRGDLAVDPVAAVERLRGDLDAILRHAQPSDVLFGPEGANRGPLIFGAIGQGETEYDDPDGAVARVPFDAARDLRETAVHAFFAATKSFRDGARAIFRFFKGLTVHGGKK